ncbi:CRE-CGP-1 protein [Caenorhabditis remanei]|uniref:CRE-CGP-1 protein n=1 Tax=Caenorhabditis remanei TaxID=31234 RepID=E3LKT0_CAERE|nr:CRE-CGP-1 protein [Caenorhabditis remanei]
MDRIQENQKKAVNLCELYADDSEDVTEQKEQRGLDAQFLLRSTTEDIEKYSIHLRKQLLEGEGECLIELGVPINSNSKNPKLGIPEDEFQKAVDVHQKILEKIPAIGTHVVRRKQAGNLVTEVWLIRDPPEEKDFIEARVAVVGNVDAGKSTLLGVLTHSALDDGRGAARTKLFRHKHEFESGRTSSVGNDILGFDVHGNVVNKPDPHNHNLDWIQIGSDCAKLVTFIDLAGHEKYLKTTIFGMTGHMPDYTMLMIGANMGIIGTTKEHLSLALSLHVPVYLVVTKIDMCPANILEETMKNITRLVRSAKKLPILVRNMDDVVHAAVNFPSKKVCPIFQVSNVDGTNLPLLRQFLNVVPLRRSLNENDPAHFQIDDIYWVDGVGTIASGTLLSGTIRLNDILLLGPTSNGDFQPIPIKSIHRKRMPVGIVKCGQSASFALKKVPKKDVRKGMVLVDPKIKPVASMLFDAEILVLHHPTTIKPNYQAMLHIGSVRQTATLVSMGKEVLRTGDRDKVQFKFIRQPEYIRPGTKMVFREGRTKAVGTVLSVVPQESLAQQRAKQKEGRNKHYGKKTNGPKPPNGKPKVEKQLESLSIDKIAEV